MPASDPLAPAAPASAWPPFSSAPTGGGGRIALVCANRDSDAVRQAARAALQALAQALPQPAAVDAFEVGELAQAPLMAKKLARSGRYRAIIACGLAADADAEATAGQQNADDAADAVRAALAQVACATAVPVFPALLVAHRSGRGTGWDSGALGALGAPGGHGRAMGQQAAQDCLRLLLGSADAAPPQAMG